MPKAKKQKRKINYYLIILDKSGSMSSVATDTISGFNEQVQTVKDLTRKHPDQEFVVSLVTFNHEVDYVFFGAESDELDEIKDDAYSPDGMTALYDAVCLSINKVRHDMKKELKNEDVHVFCTIFTDGCENHSVEFTREQFNELTKSIETDKSWTLTYIGANHDVGAAAAGMGISAGNTAAFSHTGVGSKAAMRGVSAVLRRSAEYRSAGLDSDDDRFDSMVSDVYDKAYTAEVDNMTIGGTEAKPVWDKDKSLDWKPEDDDTKKAKAKNKKPKK